MPTARNLEAALDYAHHRARETGRRQRITLCASHPQLREIGGPWCGLFYVSEVEAPR